MNGKRVWFSSKGVIRNRTAKVAFMIAVLSIVGTFLFTLLVATGTAQQASTTPADNAMVSNACSVEVTEILLDKVSGAAGSSVSVSAKYSGDAQASGQVILTSSGGQKISIGNVTALNGTLSGNATIPADAALGDYGITINLINLSGACSANAPSIPFTITDIKPPTTTSNAPVGWQKSNFTVLLSCDDGNGSGCKETRFTIDNGSQQVGNSITINTDGNHTIKYYSIDNAGNQEALKTVQAQLDKTAPSGVMKINNAAAYTKKTAVTINSAVTDVSPIQMRFQNAGGGVVGVAALCCF